MICAAGDSGEGPNPVSSIRATLIFTHSIMIVLAVTTVVVLMGIAVLVESVIIIHVAIFYAIVFHVVMDVTVFIVVACNVCLHAEYLIA